MSNQILTSLIFSFCFPFIAMGYSNNCISFVFVTSDYNGQTISCNDGNDGTLTVNTFGGTEPYQYLWEDGSTNDSRSNLNAGTYSVTINDALGCNITASITLQNPSGISLIQNISTPVSCINSTDGALTASAIGGVAPYTFEWETGGQTETASDLGCGTYGVTVTDANGCSKNAIFGLSCPSIMQVGVNATSNYNGFNLSCPESSDGIAEAIVAQGEPPYSYEWSSGEETIIANNLVAGINGLTVTDNKGCSIISFIDMTAPAEMVLTPNIQSDFEGFAVSCENAADGDVILEIENGVTPYNIEWENGETDPHVTNLIAGSNFVIVTDALGCKIQQDVPLSVYQISMTPDIQSDYNGLPISCNGASDARFKMNVEAGASSPPNITYSWNTGQDVELIENAPAGTYTLTVTSPFGCSASKEIIIDEPMPINADAVATSDYNGYSISINGLTNGSANVIPSGGIGPYNFLWENGSSDPENFNLGAGTQVVSVTDINGCIIATSVELNEPTILEGFADVLSNYHGQDISCEGYEDGQAIALGSGAVPPYTFKWSNNTTGDSTQELSAGTYQVTITDLNGATLTSEVTLIDPQPIIIDLDASASTNPPSGLAKAVATGGTPPLQYSWNDDFSRATAEIDGLAPGWYRVTVTDANGCEETDQIEIELSNEIPCIKENMTFTPNGDGKNDFLSLSCIHPFKNEIEIFDRWGNTVYSINDYDGSWDGMKNNKQVPDGGYFYIIQVALPTGKRTFKGSLTLIR